MFKYSDFLIYAVLMCLLIGVFTSMDRCMCLTAYVTSVYFLLIHDNETF